MIFRIFLLGLMLVSLPALAQREGKADAQRSALLETLARGVTVKIGREEYRHLPEAYAVQRTSRGQKPAQVLSSPGRGADTFLEEKGRYMIFRRPAGVGSATASSAGANVVYPTVLNSRTGAIGILPGTMVAHLRSMADAEHVAATHNIEIERRFPHLGAVFFRVKTGGDVLAAAAALRSDSRISSAYPEIIEHVESPH